MKVQSLLLVLAVCWGLGPSLQAAGLIVVEDAGVLPGGPIHRRPPPGHPFPPPRVYPFAPLELTSHKVNVEIKDQTAQTSVEQEFYNPNPRQLEGTFLFPLPKGAMISRFSMKIAGREVEAELMRADKARKLYEEIVRKAKDPALLEYADRDLYKVRIFPIEPHEKKRVTIAYTQLLKSDSGLVSYVYPLSLAKFSSKPISELSLSIDLESSRPIRSIYSPSHTVEVRRRGSRRATIGYESSRAQPEGDFQLFFAPESGDIDLHLLAYRKGSGSEKGFFVMLASPGVNPSGRVAAKDVAFVIDTSGSMSGAKLEQAKKALQFCVENLQEKDRFEIIRFATETEPLFGRLKDASSANRSRAFEFIQGLRPIGGTAIDEALTKALELADEDSERPFVVIFLTDGRPTVGTTDTDEIVARIKRNSGGNTRVFCFGIGHDLNAHLLDRITETTRAVSQYVLPEEDIEVKVSNFFTKIKEPVLANLKMEVSGPVRLSQMYPSPLPDLFKGEQLVVAGRFTGSGKARITLTGSVEGEEKEFKYEARFPEEEAEHAFVPRLWAVRRVGFLLDEIRLRGESKELRDEVAELAREYGIVTPHTAYLILEDEARRDVPLTVQTLGELRQNSAAEALVREQYLSLNRVESGQAAVANALSSLALRQADNSAEAVQQTARQTSRVLAAGGLAGGAGGPPASASSFGLGVRSTAGAGLGRAQVNPAATPDQLAFRALVDSTRQNQYVNGRTFYQNGNQWVDAEVQNFPKARRIRIQFNSPEYFNLLKNQAEVLPWVALGRNVQFVYNTTIYEIYE